MTNTTTKPGVPDYRYRVRGLDGVTSLREPTVGRWYVEMVEDDDATNPVAGQLAEYIGEGQWDDEGSECRMVDHDYLQEQFSGAP